MANQLRTAPPTAFEVGTRKNNAGVEVPIISATNLLKYKPNLDVEAARKAMEASGEAPGSLSIRAGNQARRAAFQQAQLARMSTADARAAAQAAYDMTVQGVVDGTIVVTDNGPKNLLTLQYSDGQAPTVRPVSAPEVAAKVVTVRTAADQRAGITQPVTVPTARDLRAERIDTPQFYGEIKQDGGQWVAELVYKNGAGTERFAAPTKNALMFKLLEGKGHATVQVRRVTNDIKRRSVEYEKTYKFKMSQADFDKVSPEARQELIDAEAARAAIQFKEAHTDDFYPTAYNSQKLMDLLDSKQAIVSVANLEKAFEELSANDELEVRTETVTPYVPEGAAELEDSNSPVVVASAVSTPAVVPTPEPVVRKRGTLGLMPGFASSGATTSELDGTEDGNQPRELSVAELKALTPAQHRALYQASLAANKKGRSF